MEPVSRRQLPGVIPAKAGIRYSAASGCWVATPEPVVGPAHRVRPLAGPMAGSGRTRWRATTHGDDRFDVKPPLGASLRSFLRRFFRGLLCGACSGEDAGHGVIPLV